MADWIIDRNGAAVLILDEQCFRSLRGEVTAWLFGNGVYAVNGDHIGWFENATLSDLHDKPVGTLAQPEHAAAQLPMPLFARRPHVPRLKARHSRSGRPGHTEGASYPLLWQAGVPRGAMPAIHA